MQSKGHNLELWEFKGCKPYVFEEHDLGNYTPLRVHNPRKIKSKHGGVVVSEHEKKEYKVVFKKRRLMDDFDSFPCGYD